MSTRIRVSAEADVDEMQRIRRAVRENRLVDPAAVQDHHVREMITERGRGWVAEVEGRIAGLPSATWPARTCGRCSWTRSSRPAASAGCCTTR